MPFFLLNGTGGAGCARTPACSGSGCGCGCQSHWPLIDPLNGSRRTHAQQEQRILGLRVLEPSIHLNHLLREQDEQCFAETAARRPPFWQDLLPPL